LSQVDLINKIVALTQQIQQFNLLQSINLKTWDPISGTWQNQQNIQEIQDGIGTVLPVDIGSATNVFRPVRRGQLVFADGFEDALNWVQVNGTVSQDTTALKQIHGLKSLKCLSPSGASNTVGEAKCTIFLPPMKRIYASVFINPDFSASSDNAYAFTITHTNPIDNKGLVWGVRFNFARTSLEYLNSSNSWVGLPGGPTLYMNYPYGVNNEWLHLFFECRIDTETYGKVYCGKSMDLSSIPMYSYNDSAYPKHGRTVMDLSITAFDGESIFCNFDDVSLSAIFNLT
jgi:hypothetical protein